jgi:trimeric autotransporter adhesin
MRTNETAKRWLRRGTTGLAAAALTLLTATAAPATAVTVPGYTSTPTPSWTPTSGTVYAMARSGDTVVLGGSFTALRSPDNRTVVTRDRLAAIDAVTGALLPWNPGADDTVRALETSADGTSVYVGGQFAHAGGAARSRIADLSLSTGAPVAGFTASTNGTVYALKRAGATLYLGGGFRTVDGAPHPYLAAVSTISGASAAGFGGSADNSVFTIGESPTPGNLVVGGRFTTLGGTPRVYLGQIEAATGATTGWTPDVCTGAGSSNLCYVYGVVHDATSVYAGVGGSGGRVVALTATGGGRRWTGYTDGDVQAIAIHGTTIYAGGHFDTQFGGRPRAGLVELNSSNGAVVEGFAPVIGHGLGVFTILAGDDRLRVGGGFDHVDNFRAARYTTFAAL